VALVDAATAAIDKQNVGIQRFISGRLSDPNENDNGQATNYCDSVVSCVIRLVVLLFFTKRKATSVGTDVTQGAAPNESRRHQDVHQRGLTHPAWVLASPGWPSAARGHGEVAGHFGLLPGRGRRTAAQASLDTRSNLTACSRSPERAHVGLPKNAPVRRSIRSGAEETFGRTEGSPDLWNAVSDSRSP